MTSTHFEFMHPWWFLLLPLVALLVLRTWLPGGRARLGWTPMAGGKSWRTLTAWLPEALGSIGFVLVIAAMARPQFTHTETVVESTGIDIVLTLDVSGSMDAQDFEFRGRRLNRLDLAKVVVGDFIEGREHDRVSLVVFGEEAFTQVPLTLDHEGVQRFLAQVEIGMAGENATAIGHAIAVGSRRLAELDNPTKVLILLTDGQDTAKNQIDPLLATEAARAVGVRIYTIGVGATGGFMNRVLRPSDPVDTKTLTRIAESTGGAYFRATDAKALEEIYATIDDLEKTTAEVKQYVHREELYRWALLPGMLLLVLRFVLDATLYRRLP
ncbi:MAG: VWA domain-containing protein [Proteobacteria bacterium]|nr:VWA domain-containing protein [Pseudomonadota bacterium]MCP4921801.1 VWA domain-containing protein [Pseudomonadota bacterium]